jgi:hypothetical protein
MEKTHVKWVKRANAWALIEPELDKKTNKMKNKITWSYEEPTIATEDA